MVVPPGEGVTLHAAPNPCNTCPYRRDVPAGIWAANEYEKLPQYDGDAIDMIGSIFHCHQENATGIDTVCRGWLSVHADSVPVRVAVMQGWLTPEQRDAEVNVPLFASGAEACKAGLAGVKTPDEAACLAVEKLAKKFAKRGEVSWK